RTVTKASPTPLQRRAAISRKIASRSCSAGGSAGAEAHRSTEPRQVRWNRGAVYGSFCCHARSTGGDSHPSEIERIRSGLLRRLGQAPDEEARQKIWATDW